MPPKKTKDHEIDDKGDVRLNPLWVPLSEFSGRDLDNSPEGAKWQYAVTEDGEISLGSEDVASLIPGHQLDRLLAGVRTKQPGLTADDLSGGLENMGHPTIAAHFDQVTGRTTSNPEGRVSGELYRIGGVSTLNDKSGRFMAEKVRGKPQTEDLERWLSGIPVTTNFMPLWSGQDAWRWAEEEDVVSVDLYPDPRDPFGAQEGALVQDMTRSQARGPWMLMEQAAGPVNWRGVNHPKPRGLNRLWSLQAVARGADAVCYFQWRQSRQGAEKFHSGMVGHAGEHGRTHQEVVQLGADLARLGPHAAGGTVGADIAVLHDWHAWWAADQEARPSARVDHADVLRAWHRALWRGGLTTDFAHPEDDLTRYKVVVVPQLYALTDAAVDNLLAHVRGGTTLVCGFLTGVADQDDRIRPGGMDARLRELFGIRTLHEWWPLDDDESADCDGFRGTLWSEEIEPDGTASDTIPYKGGELDGLPAVLRKGSAWYLSTLPEPDALRDLLARVAADAGAHPVLDALPADVEAVRRGDLLFLLHHGRDPVTVDVPGTHRELLTDAVVTDRVTLGRYGVAVLRDPEPAS
ncbi:beta-galactosidase [Streptomyces tendae]|uniref:beta-galactosidase n=1 Tax=Streptomyces tendae TaxID=1932 RepID=UPI003426B643